MPRSNTTLDEVLREARQPHHTDADVAAVVAVFGDHNCDRALYVGGASTMLDVAEEFRAEGTPPTFGEFVARISERAVGHRRRSAR
jgi:hypothetical protein